MAASDPESDFLKAATDGDLSLLKRLTSETGNGGGLTKAYETVTGVVGKNALHLAAEAGKTQICKYLVEKLKFNVDSRDNLGNTSLLLASMEQRHPTAAYLIENGAGIDCRNKGDFTALHYAAETGHKEMLRLLLSKGANITPDLNSPASTPLHCACLHGKKEAVKILLDGGADVNSVTKLYLTPLMMSVKGGSYECMELLLKAGADPNLASFEKTALIVAACVGDTAIIKRLLKAGANPNVVDTSGMTPFEQAALRGNIAAMTALFPRTSPISSFPDWSVNGIVRHVLSEEGRTQSEIKRMNDFEVSKAKGREAFQRKDYEEAILWYSEANVADPTDANVLSNRSLCWAKLNQGYHALKDAEDCVALKPNWAKAHYREGAAWMLFHEYYIASEIFSRALKLDPNNEDIKKAHREAVEAESSMPVSGNRYL